MQAKTILTLLSVAGISVLAGCQKGNFLNSGKESIQFSASTDVVGTKTVYSDYDNPSAPTWQRINWVVGDTIRIYSPQAAERYNSSQHYSDYRVYNVTTDGMRSKAKIANPGISLTNPVNDPGSGDTNGLVWGASTTHDFYAVYPAPTAVDAQGTSAVVNGTIRAKQSPNAAEKMHYAYMTAAASVTTGSPVTLEFYPCFTAFEFTVGCGENDSVTLTKFTLKSASLPIAGAFQANCSTGAVTTSSTTKEITVDLNTTLSGSETLTFTVFTLGAGTTVASVGEVLNGLSISFVGTPIGTRTLALNDTSGNPLNFKVKTKHIISNLSFPKILTVNGEDIDWDIQAMGESLIWD